MGIKTKKIMTPCPNYPELFIGWQCISHMKRKKKSLYVCVCGMWPEVGTDLPAISYILYNYKAMS